MIVDVIIPVLNEENGVGHVIEEIPKNLIRHVIVVDNGSTDNTKEVAAKKGAIVLSESRKGYGSACLRGMQYVAEQHQKPDVIIFIDGDHADYPEQMSELVQGIQDGADMVIGSRALGKREEGSMTFPQIFGNWLATSLIRLFYRHDYTDLGPFRALRYESLLKMDMQDTNYGWTVEMQLKAAKMKMNTAEIKANYRNRIGVSKISGTIKGTLMAGYKIIATIFKYL